MIDSPCGRIDHGARAQIAAIIPSLSNQFITFVQSSERANFTEVLENLSNSVNHVTIFNKVIFDKDKASLPNIPKNAIKTDDAFIIHDQKFFNEFDEAKGIQ